MHIISTPLEYVWYVFIYHSFGKNLAVNKPIEHYWKQCFPHSITAPFPAYHLLISHDASIASDCLKNICPNGVCVLNSVQESVNIFYKEPNNKYLRFCQPNSLYCKSSDLARNTKAAINKAEQVTMTVFQ